MEVNENLDFQPWKHGSCTYRHHYCTSPESLTGFTHFHWKKMAKAWHWHKICWVPKFEPLTITNHSATHKYTYFLHVEISINFCYITNSLTNISCAIPDHSSLINLSSYFRFEGLLAQIFCSPHRSSMGFKSGFHAGQSVTFTFVFWRQFFTRLRCVVDRLEGKAITQTEFTFWLKIFTNPSFLLIHSNLKSFLVPDLLKHPLNITVAVAVKQGGVLWVVHLTLLSPSPALALSHLSKGHASSLLSRPQFGRRCLFCSSGEFLGL